MFGVEESNIDLVVSSFIPCESDVVILVGSVISVTVDGSSRVSSDWIGSVDECGLSGIIDIGGVWKWSLDFGHFPEGLWSDTEVVKDNEVSVHTGGSLDNTDLEVSERDKFGVDEMVKFGLSWEPVHDIKFRVFVGKGDGWYHIGSQINAKNEHS